MQTGSKTTLLTVCVHDFQEVVERSVVMTRGGFVVKWTVYGFGLNRMAAENVCVELVRFVEAWCSLVQHPSQGQNRNSINHVYHTSSSQFPTPVETLFNVSCG